MRNIKAKEKISLRILSPKKNKLLNTEHNIIMYKRLIKLYLDMPQQAAARLMSKYRQDLFDLRNWVFQKTQGIKDTQNFKYKIFHRFIWIFGGLTEFPRCKVDGTIIGYLDNDCFSPFGYNEYCCRKCSANSKDVQRHLKNTFKKKYGVTHQMQIPEVKAKQKQSEREFYQKNFNCNSMFEKENFIQNRMQSSLEKYGVESPMQLKTVQKKQRKTVRKKYGVKSVSQIPSVKEQRMQTLKDKYGTTHVSYNYEYKGQRFDSSWELIVWIYCEEHNIPIEREPVKFYIDCDGNKHGYTPDFRIDGKLVELKGNQFFENRTKNSRMIHPYNRKKLPQKKLEELDRIAEAKHQFMIHHKIEIWNYDDIKLYKKYIEQKYGKSYILSFKVNKGNRKPIK